MNRLAFGALLVGAACSHELTGPTPTLASVSPGLVCTEAVPPQSIVTLHGDGLAALVSNTLVGDDYARVPTVELLRVADAMGTPITPGAAVQIPDEPGWVTWLSPTELRVELPLPMDEGIYDVTITNPDGKIAVLTAGLGLIPAPEIAALVPPQVCTEVQDNTVTVMGVGFFFSATEGPPTVMVGDRAYPATDPMQCFSVSGGDGTQVCSQLSFTIPAGDLPLGPYMVSVQNPGAGACSTMEPATLEVVPPPTVTDVQPDMVCGGGTGVITVTGVGFVDGATVLIDGTTPAETTFVSDTTLTAVVPGGVTPGNHQVAVMNPDGCTSQLAATFEVLGGAYVFFVDPPVVPNAIDVQITVYATLVTGPISRVQIQPTGNAAARMEIPSMFDASRPGRVTAVVPSGLAAGAWDVLVTDGTSCEAILEGAFTITSTTTLALTAIDPPFGHTGGETAVIIRAAGGLTATPRAYLSPSGGSGVATALEAVSFLSPTLLTAVAPAGMGAGDYDLIVVNPDGQAGVLTSAFQVNAQPPPTITGLTPGTVDTGSTATVTITGAGFSSPSVSLTCKTPAGTILPPVTATVTSSNATQITAQFPTGSLPAGTVCVLIVTNGDGSFGEFSAISVTNPASNLEPFRAMASLRSARRGLAAVSGRPTQTSRFLYAIGGDDGVGGAPYATVERSAIGDFGDLGAFVAERNALPAGRTIFGAARIGDFIYVVGGREAGGPTASVARARILDPRDVPVIADVDLAPGSGTGLGPGTWVYRVSATWPSNDPSDPSGETLPSEPFTIMVPSGGEALLVTLSWGALPGAAGYRVYRNEQLLAEVTEATFTDDGTLAPTIETPIPVGSLGRWSQVATLTVAREGAAVVAAQSPSSANVWFLYAGGGRAATPHNNYEFAQITIAGDGSQSIDPFEVGSGSIGAARWQVAGWSVDSRLASVIPPGTTYVYFGGGLDGAGVPSATTMVGQVTSTGDLSGLTAVDGIPAERAAGCGAVPANGMLFAFGGGTGSVCGDLSAPPCLGGHSAQICSGAGGGCTGGAPELRGWNSLGGGGILTARVLMGTVLEGAFIYVLGGETATGATATTEGAVW